MPSFSEAESSRLFAGESAARHGSAATSNAVAAHAEEVSLILVLSEVESFAHWSHKTYRSYRSYGTNGKAGEPTAGPIP